LVVYLGENIWVILITFLIVVRRGVLSKLVDEDFVNMNFKRPKIIGTLKIQLMMSGTLAVMNDIKNAPNKIIIPCVSEEHGEEIIAEIKSAKFGDKLHF
jgi:hypothetical protein